MSRSDIPDISIPSLFPFEKGLPGVEPGFSPLLNSLCAHQLVRIPRFRSGGEPSRPIIALHDDATGEVFNRAGKPIELDVPLSRQVGLIILRDFQEGDTYWLRGLPGMYIHTHSPNPQVTINFRGFNRDIGFQRAKY